MTQEEFETQAEVTLASLRMPPEQREKFLKKYAEERLLTEDRQAHDFIHDKSVQSGMSLFGEALPVDIRQSVLRGGEPIRVPVSQLSPQGQAFVHSTWTDFRGFRTRHDGTREPIPQPTWVQFRRACPPLGPAIWRLTPACPTARPSDSSWINSRSVRPISSANGDPTSCS